MTRSLKFSRVVSSLDSKMRSARKISVILILSNVMRSGCSFSRMSRFQSAFNIGMVAQGLKLSIKKIEMSASF